MCANIPFFLKSFFKDNLKVENTKLKNNVSVSLRTIEELKSGNVGGFLIKNNIIPIPNS